ncbi:MAG: hypothetical protein HN926_07910 [Chloroflexi bacterium]|jgi:hypothetical protein|nr:hypothetical protein [Chloroflexota bacterium]MBT4342289.1 hypothetical protein [Chloroflexota bacterium]MBT5477227.1 hypothetical protein [Chloroflexota bacterium]MBT7079270.1 hypothetical protein [Chloroflexota bacterium]MBT7833470.1 hypothetical protein [Chloroflexota bacterium]
MTIAENIAQIKDIVVVVFLLFSFVVVGYVTFTLVRLRSRMNRFMDRMENVADGFEETFGRVAVARQAVHDAAAVLKPVAQGLGLVNVFQGVGRLFGVGGSSKAKDTDENGK